MRRLILALIGCALAWPAVAACSAVPFTFSAGTTIQSSQVNADFSALVTCINNIAAAQIVSGQLALARGGTAADLSATGGTSQVLRQSSAGAVVTVSQLAAANLSDYTAATAWTPVLAGSTGAGTPTYTTQVGWYTKIGNEVLAHFYIVTSAWGGVPTGTITVSGLPVTAGSGTDQRGQCAISVWGGLTLTAGYTSVGGIIVEGTAAMFLFQGGSAQVANNVAVAAGTAINLQGVCSYHS